MTDPIVLDVPVIRDETLRQELLRWFQGQADAWHRQADALTLFGAETQAASAHGRAVTLEWAMAQLEQAARESAA